jgi:catalase (peroxidase I)
MRALKLAVVVSCATASCPFLAGRQAQASSNPHRHDGPRQLGQQIRRLEPLGYNVSAVKDRISSLLPNSSADFGNHGGFMIRLAWHCAGTYRTSDGRGGCDGGRIRFEPENSWDDNAGLNEMLSLLEPVKAEFGAPLSWGDLIVLAGSTAIESMGGPQIQFCGGRVDDVDGTESLPLEDGPPGKDQLIYVDAGAATGLDVREAFLHMDFGDKETVALVAGGHTFGKCHASRSGFEGKWTHTPTQWSGSYLTNLLNNNWTLGFVSGSSGKMQYTDESGLMMLVADFNMANDTEYRVFMEEYERDESQLKADFGKAWEKLMNRDMGHKPCAGEEMAANTPTVNYEDVKAKVKAMLRTDKRQTDFNHYGPLFVRFAWHCSGTFRSTDYRGGCNGARIMHSPEKDWPDNDGLVEGPDEPQGEIAVSLLQPIKDQFGVGLSWADLIIISGTVALEDMGGPQITFCPGRSDVNASEAQVGSKYLDPTIYLNPENATAADVKKSMNIMGFTAREMTVLNGGGHAVGKAHASKSGFEGPWTQTRTQLSNVFFTTLMDNKWIETKSPMNRTQFTDEATGTLMMLHTDLAFKNDPEFRDYSNEYKANNTKFLLDFAAAWQKLINADRYDCDQSAAIELPTAATSTSKATGKTTAAESTSNTTEKATAATSPSKTTAMPNTTVREEINTNMAAGLVTAHWGAALAIAFASLCEGRP